MRPETRNYIACAVFYAAIVLFFVYLFHLRN
jgi:hypothetical protein